jgi:hypothetical protein
MSYFLEYALIENLLRHQVTSVYRRRYCVHVDRIVMDKRNGQQVPSSQRPCISSLPPNSTELR